MADRVRPRVLLAMEPALLPRLFDDIARDRLTTLADVDFDLVVDDFQGPAARAALPATEILLTCWGAPPIDETVLAVAPRLRAVVHAAGSIRHLITEACWRAGIRVSSAAWANGLPVAEYTLAWILLANKRALEVRRRYREHRGEGFDTRAFYLGAGNYRRTVGIIGASRIGRRVVELLRPYDIEVVLNDPFVTAVQAAELGVRPVELDELCGASDVVSIHAPRLPATDHLIDARRLALLRDGATLINTARGTLVDQEAMVAELATGRINAIIDVTEPDLLPADSPLYDLPNVFLTPHIAGSMGDETYRLAASAVDEIDRYAAGLPFAFPVSREEMSRSA
jgi:phosphoglycerate dehydrogenase-like enzyme